MPTHLPGAHGPARLRLWPGVVIVLVQWLARFGLPLALPEATMYAVLAGLAGGPALVVWWLFFSRAAWRERIGAVALMAGIMAATWPFLDASIATGAMGMLFPMLATPTVCLAFIAWAAASRRIPGRLGMATLAAAIAAASGMWTLARTGGFTGGFDNDLAWRWAPTPEERLLARADMALPPAGVTPPIAPAPAPALPAGVAASNDAPAPAEQPSAPRVEELTDGEAHPLPPPEWTGFRGPRRDGVVRGVRIGTDWASAPPALLWRRPIGPGWSSFAVGGGLLYTQEQRGDEEMVAAYRIATGEPVWTHRDGARFWESNGGAGPRGTPTLHAGRLYAFGATGILNALDAASGRLLWRRDVSADSGVPVPDWGFSSSPLIVDGLVIVAAAGKLAAYDASSGAPRWFGPDGGPAYSSPHLMTMNGVDQILLLAGNGAASVAVVDGATLWNVKISTSAMSAPIVQPAVTADGDILISDGTASGMNRFTIAHGAAGWSAAERWRTTALKPFFNDMVIHNGHAYGFDGSFLACVDVADGTRKWKGGRYGNGQLVLLADQDLLLVVTEEGELALAAASPDKHTELARVPAIDGKTWNHPVVVGDLLLVRNGEEMAAFRLSR